jgi:hypothetical protein
MSSSAGADNSRPDELLTVRPMAFPGSENWLPLPANVWQYSARNEGAGERPV